MGVSLGLASSLLAGCGGGDGGPGAPPPVEVVVATAERGELPLDLAYSGRAVGSREVEVRALVSGILLQRRYEEGSAVRQGDVLFRIDPARYRAAVEQARAELGVERAKLAEALRQGERLKVLVTNKLVSAQQLDEAISVYEVAEANTAAAQARLRAAELDLGYTEVRAPIAGLTSSEVRSEGSLVTAGDESSLLTRIVQTDPIYVEFALPEAEAAQVRARLAGDNLPQVRVELQGGTRLPDPARLTFVDNAVEATSGTVRARAVLPNPDGRLVPGQFLRAEIEGVSLPDAVSVPRRAVMSSAQGSFVWRVGEGDVVELQPVRVVTTVGERVVVAEGLTGGERVIVEGVLKVQPGAKVAIGADAAAPGAAGAAPPGGGPGNTPGDGSGEAGEAGEAGERREAGATS
jgi:membrane fusion protein (multidrug efflux system)